ncbi:hypothetical protein GVX82_01410 [Patescibacteria group bacterium]|nr:hypothetical protein [Patescibacteria group bacterium]
MRTVSEKTRISAILPAHLVREMKKTAESMGIPNSAVLQKALEDWLMKRLDQDTKELAALSLTDMPDEDTWASLQSETNHAKTG